jgi:hypothetical protein
MLIDGISPSSHVMVSKKGFIVPSSFNFALCEQLRNISLIHRFLCFNEETWVACITNTSYDCFHAHADFSERIMLYPRISARILLYLTILNSHFRLRSYDTLYPDRHVPSPNILEDASNF